MDPGSIYLYILPNSHLGYYWRVLQLRINYDIDMMNEYINISLFWLKPAENVCLMPMEHGNIPSIVAEKGALMTNSLVLHYRS